MKNKIGAICVGAGYAFFPSVWSPEMYHWVKECNLCKEIICLNANEDYAAH